MQHLTLNISLNTVLTVISLIDPGLYGSFRFSSQYRSHGYLFNQYKFTTQDGQERRLNTVLTVISLISRIVSFLARKEVSIPFSRLSL